MCRYICLLWDHHLVSLTDLLRGEHKHEAQLTEAGLLNQGLDVYLTRLTNSY